MWILQRDKGGEEAVGRKFAKSSFSLPAEAEQFTLDEPYDGSNGYPVTFEDPSTYRSGAKAKALRHSPNAERVVAVTGIGNGAQVPDKVFTKAFNVRS